MKGKDEMNSQKPFKTYNQQLKILRSRNIEINDGSKAIRILKREGYYNIVNGYKEIFLDTALTASKGKDWYKPGTKFDYLYALYDFDRSLKRCLLGYILKMETFLKTQIAYFFSDEYRQNFSYLDINNFDSSNPQAVTKLIAKVSNVITNNSAEQIQGGQVFHYLSNYKELPLWVLINKMTLGETYHLFDVLQPPIKTKILKEIVHMYEHEYKTSINYNMNDTRSLSEIFRFINGYRNICAHDARLFNTVIRHGKGKIPKITHFHKKTSIPFKSRLFDCIVILGLFLSRNDYKKLISQISLSLNDLQKHLPPNLYNMVLIQMGFSKTWKQDISLP